MAAWVGLIFLAALAAAGPCTGQERTAAAAFGPHKTLLVLSESADNGLALATIDIKSAETSAGLFYPEATGRVLSPTLKIDRKGQAWAVWETWEDSRSLVGLGRLLSLGAVAAEKVPQPGGWNCSPDLSFDALDNPWLAWVNDRIGEQSLYVRDIRRGKTWRLATAGSFVGPQIATDSQGRIWVFWAAADSSRSRFFFSTYDGLSWSPAIGIGQPSSYPIHSFSAALDARDTARIVWSQYDGRSYAIFAMMAGLGQQATVTRLTENSVGNDVFPSLGLSRGSLPVVCWVRMTQKGGRLFLRYRRGGGWSEEKELPGYGSSASVPQMTLEGDQAAFVWWSGDKLEWRVVTLDQMVRLPPGRTSSQMLAAPLQPPFLPSAPRFLYNPALDESTYIGFGDSITYGVIDSEFHPDLGYVPRLQSQLSQSFGPNTVVNEGVPSEITLNGLARIGGVLDQDKALFVLILEGTNDTITKIWSLEASAFNLREMTRQSLAAGVLPALATLLPRFDTSAKPVRILDLNMRIREIAKEMAVPLVDLNEDFIDYPPEDGGVESLISNDHLHPNEKGYQFMADKWYEAIRGFPFAPETVHIWPKYDRMHFYRGRGIRLNWFDNPKIADRGLILGYQLYRKVGAGSDASFEFLAFVGDSRQYIDQDVAVDTEYTYIIATLLSNGIEGPCSTPVKF